MFNVFVSTCAVAFHTTHGQNKTRKYDTEGLVPVASLYGDPTTPYKLATGKKPSVSHLRVLFCLCVVWKATAHVETKTLNMRHQA